MDDSDISEILTRIKESDAKTRTRIKEAKDSIIKEIAEHTSQIRNAHIQINSSIDYVNQVLDLLLKVMNGDDIVYDAKKNDSEEKG